MRIAIILNGISKKKNFFLTKVYPALQLNFQVSLLETKYCGHATQLAYEAADQYFDLIISAGGDGTLNQVLNGMLQSESASKPCLALFPLGSANDFARTVQIIPSVNQLMELINVNAVQSIDVGEVNCVDKEGKPVKRFFINACSVGMGPLVVERLERNKKKLGASLSYLVSIFVTFLTHKPQLITCKTPEWQWEGKARVAAFANGISFGNGIYIAPDALPNDGILNSFIAEDVPLAYFLVYLQTIKARKRILNQRIQYKKLATVELSSLEACALEAEGEVIGYLPAAIQIKNQKIRFLKPYS
jgi:diacylglycerol kinase (ATP)